MCAGPHEVQISVARMPIGWPEVSHLRQRMRQPVSCASLQVIAFTPRERGIRFFEFNVCFEVSNTEGPHTAKDLLARLVSQFAPILFSILAQVTNWDNRDQSILSWRSHGWVEPRRCMNIQAGIGGQAQISDDTLEVLAVIVRQEKSMRAEGFIRLIHSPEETDCGTGESLARQCLGHPVLRK